MWQKLPVAQEGISGSGKTIVTGITLGTQATLPHHDPPYGQITNGTVILPFMMSVVVPAYNEAPALGRLLTGLLDGAVPGQFEVFVVANGCTDGTAATARSFGPMVRVIETPVANKHRAMRQADAAAADRFPRLYVDADVELRAADVTGLAAALQNDGRLLAVGPERVVPTAGCPWTVRWFYDVWLTLPVVRAGLFGRGVVGVTELGHRRLATLPELMGDDLAASLAFGPDERTIVPETRVIVHPPRTCGDLIRRRTRVVTVTTQAGAQAELAAAGAAARTGRSDLLALIRKAPLTMTPRVAWFLCVTAVSRRRARRAVRAGDYQTWLRDESSRAAVDANAGGRANG